MLKGGWTRKIEVPASLGMLREVLGYFPKVDSRGAGCLPVIKLGVLPPGPLARNELMLVSVGKGQNQEDQVSVRVQNRRGRILNVSSVGCKYGEIGNGDMTMDDQHDGGRNGVEELPIWMDYSKSIKLTGGKIEVVEETNGRQSKYYLGVGGKIPAKEVALPDPSTLTDFVCLLLSKYSKTQETQISIAMCYFWKLLEELLDTSIQIEQGARVDDLLSQAVPQTVQCTIFLMKLLDLQLDRLNKQAQPQTSDPVQQEWDRILCNNIKNIEEIVSRVQTMKREVTSKEKLKSRLVGLKELAEIQPQLQRLASLSKSMGEKSKKLRIFFPEMDEWKETIEEQCAVPGSKSDIDSDDSSQDGGQVEEVNVDKQLHSIESCIDAILNKAARNVLGAGKPGSQPAQVEMYLKPVEEQQGGVKAVITEPRMMEVDWDRDWIANYILGEGGDLRLVVESKKTKEIMCSHWICEVYTSGKEFVEDENIVLITLGKDLAGLVKSVDGRYILVAGRIHNQKIYVEARDLGHSDSMSICFCPLNGKMSTLVLFPQQSSFYRLNINEDEQISFITKKCSASRRLTKILKKGSVCQRIYGQWNSGIERLDIWKVYQQRPNLQFTSSREGPVYKLDFFALHLN